MVPGLRALGHLPASQELLARAWDAGGLAMGTMDLMDRGLFAPCYRYFFADSRNLNQHLRELKGVALGVSHIR